MLASELSSQARLVALTLLVMSDARTCVIPADFTPSLSRLVKVTGLGNSTVKRALNQLEEGGWVIRSRPPIEKARADHERTQYRLSAPGMAHTGPSQAHTGPSSRATQGHGHGPERATSKNGFSDLGQQQSPQQLVMSKTDAKPEEADAVVARIVNERNPTSVGGFLGHLAKVGELQDWVNQVRSARIKIDRDQADVADRKMRQSLPRCHHGMAGGELPHSETRAIRCKQCRDIQRLNERKSA